MSAALAITAVVVLPALAIAVVGRLACWALEESADVLIAWVERRRGGR